MIEGHTLVCPDCFRGFPIDQLNKCRYSECLIEKYREWYPEHYDTPYGTPADKDSA